VVDFAQDTPVQVDAVVDYLNFSLGEVLQLSSSFPDSMAIGYNIINESICDLEKHNIRPRQVEPHVPSRGDNPAGSGQFGDDRSDAV